MSEPSITRWLARYTLALGVSLGLGAVALSVGASALSTLAVMLLLFGVCALVIDATPGDESS